MVALDTELLGVHWHEGVAWLAEVLAAADRAGLRIAPLDDLLGECEPAPAPALPVTSWGDPARPDHLERARGGRARLAPAGGRAARGRGRCRTCPSARCASCSRCSRRTGRSSSTHATAGDYPRERAAGHEAAFEAALAAPGEHPAALRNLAPHLARGALSAP